MDEQSAEPAIAAVQRLQQELAAHPDNGELRMHLAWAYKRLAEDSLSITIYQVRVITDASQRWICRDAAMNILQLAPEDERLRTFANDLLTEINSGSRWTWESKSVAFTLMTCAIILGVALVVVGAMIDNIPMIVAAAVVSSAALAGVILGFRKETWRINAKRVQPLIAHPEG